MILIACVIIFVIALAARIGWAIAYRDGWADDKRQDQ